MSAEQFVDDFLAGLKVNLLGEIAKFKNELGIGIDNGKLSVAYEEKPVKPSRKQLGDSQSGTSKSPKTPNTSSSDLRLPQRNQDSSDSEQRIQLVQPKPSSSAKSKQTSSKSVTDRKCPRIIKGKAGARECALTATTEVNGIFYCTKCSGVISKQHAKQQQKDLVSSNLDGPNSKKPSSSATIKNSVSDIIDRIAKDQSREKVVINPKKTTLRNGMVAYVDSKGFAYDNMTSKLTGKVVNGVLVKLLDLDDRGYIESNRLKLEAGVTYKSATSGPGGDKSESDDSSTGSDIDIDLSDSFSSDSE